MFVTNVQDLVSTNKDLEQIILPLLEAWRGIRTRAAGLPL